jgi:hypothetical protein
MEFKAVERMRLWLGWCPKSEVKDLLRPPIESKSCEDRGLDPDAKKVQIEHHRVEAEELWERSKYFFVLFGAVFATSALYKIFWMGEIFSGTLSLILAVILPLAFYRGYLVAVIFLIWGGFLATRFQINAGFVYMPVVLYVIAKEYRRIRLESA